MNLVEIIYYRNDDVENLKTAVVTEEQAYDIKNNYRWIKIMSMRQAPDGSKRNYVLP